MPLIFHVQRQASGSTLARVVVKELEHCVAHILVFIYCHMVEGGKALWPFQGTGLLPHYYSVVPHIFSG